MAKLTIAQLRELEVDKLAKMDSRSIEEDEKKASAKKIMNRFYRFAALRVRNFYDDNDEKRQATKWHKEEEEKEDKRFKELNKDLKDIYNLSLIVSGLYPHIGVYENHCVKSIEIYGNFYN